MLAFLAIYGILLGACRHLFELVERGGRDMYCGECEGRLRGAVIVDGFQRNP